MREATHPRQSSVLTAGTVVTCSLFVAIQLLRFGFTPANVFSVAVAAALAIILWAARSATLGAAAVGALMSATLTLGTIGQPTGAWRRTALPPLIALMAFALFATRFRRAKKEQLGLAEAKSGRRASQVCANLGAASFAAIFCVFGHPRLAFLLALAAALVEATADTVSSETGQALQGKTILLTTGRPVAAGTDGGISLRGTILGCLSGAGVAWICAVCLRFSMPQALICWAAGVGGIFLDSWLGATLERRGILGNDAVNFLSTAFSALLAGVAGTMVAR
jgi:uncharacterized protein (TIGR00297 family)